MIITDENYCKEIVRVKHEYEDELLALDNVHAVSIGYKEVNGVKTDTLAIVIHTTLKEEEANLNYNEIVPPFLEGFPTDVVEMPPFDYIPTEFDEDEINLSNIDGKKYRPVPGGVEIYMPRTEVNGGICTSGMYAQSIKEGDSASDLYLLTNAHCLREVSQAVMQPISDSPEELIAFSSRVIDNDRIDGGIAKMTNYENADPFTIVDLGQITGVYDITVDNLGDKVVKRGRTSGITIGVIDYVFVTIIDKKDQIVVRGEVPFAEPGDSGSVVLMYEGESENNVMGLLWGGVLNYAILSPIRAVSEELEIALITTDLPIFQFE